MKEKNNTVLGYEDKLYKAADKLRGSMDAGEYKHVVLGLIFLKYVSDAFEAKYLELKEDKYADEEDKDEYTSENIFWVPKIARWDYIKQHANTPEIGKIIDLAMEEIEKSNNSLKGVLNKNYSRPELEKSTLGQLVTLFSNLEVGTDKAQEMDVLGRTYEYCISQFAAAEGKNGGEFYTPTCIVKTLVEMIEPFNGRIYDPACGSGGMFVQSSKFIKEHQGNLRDIAVYGQERNPTTWKLAKMNLAIRQIEGNLGTHNADTFKNDLHKTLKADYILANPPFNISDWDDGVSKEDVRWKYGTPYSGNANYAWLQHMLHHLNPETGVAGIVLANGALASEISNEGSIRKAMIEDDKVDCIVAMPVKLFYSVTIPCSLWIMRKNKSKEIKNKILFIDARQMGTMINRKLKELTSEDIKKIANTYQSWLNDENYKDELDFCKSVKLETIRNNNYTLTPGRYIGNEILEDDNFEEKIKELTEKFNDNIIESQNLSENIKKILEEISYGI